ncbi:TonB-linked outer membrane protein, SusC/RagA family [Parapedobacter composti]|uniref:TonB-linked outer membrane protein, SusC/RagA family n=1 Tax=Parapedobacter composti TaxID=623281 RepID=A0A1I1FNR2_9SPHI|nr:TonB-dependent receptor [Parapedobacter composti]SFC00642.1 TonB-linked outer membrane protein, SusC/RagA family [Parapedobacter composti]
MKPISLLLLFLLCIAALPTFAQRSIKGTVRGTDGTPISGVSVAVKGAPRGTMTNDEGAYVINSVRPSDILVFSAVGFQRQEQPVTDRQIIDIILTADEITLEEVVVGYDVVRKEDLTGAVGTVNARELAAAPAANFDQALAGRVAGVQVTSRDGTPGAPLNIVIRGGNSITGDNSPLYVVDGVPLEGFDPSTINTRDIKSFDILKDASATAIYGSRGANGVVVITTHSGRSDGRTDVDVSSSSWFETIPNRMEVLSPYEYVKYQEKLAYANDNYVPGENVQLFLRRWVDPELYRNAAGTDWQEEIFRTARSTNHTVSLRGGNVKTTLLYSGNYLNQDGTLINTGFRKINNRLKVTHKIAPDFEINGQVEYSRNNHDGHIVSGNSRNSVIRDAISFRPINPVNWTSDDESSVEDMDPYLFDPVKILNNTERTRVDDVLSGTLGFNFKFLKKFEWSTMGNYRTTLRETTIFHKRDTYEASRTSRGINGSITDNRWDILSTSNLLRFKDQKNKHTYGMLAGVEAQYNTSEYSFLQNTNLPTDEFGIHNLGIATTPTISRTDYSRSALLSFFGRANYAYDNRYLATINFRTDGSSKFRKANRWGYFPSFSLAWRLSEEQFIKPIEAISDLKLRGGWGVTGNNRIGDFVAYNLFSVNANSGYILGTGQTYSPGAFQSNMAVPDLRWEKTAQSNIGLDLELMRKFNLTVDVYQKNTKDLLLGADMALSTGFDRVQQNVGEVSNRGIEFTFESQNIRKSDFVWRTNFNIAFNRTKTIQLNSGQQQILTDPEWDVQFMQTEYQYITRVGQPVGMIYGFVFDGIYQVDDFLFEDGAYRLKEGIPTHQSVTKPGMVRFKDINGDGVINQNDRTIIGNPHPKHTGGLFNSFNYKSFDFQFLLQWAYGFDILNGNKSEYGSIYHTNRNGLKSLANIWTPTNPETDIGGMRFDGTNLLTPFGYKLDSRHVDDGSYIKLKTVVLGYNLPERMLSSLRMKRCRLSLSAQNLLTLTKYEGYDPDVSVGRFGALTPGLDYSAYPQSLTVSAGLELSF